MTEQSPQLKPFIPGFILGFPALVALTLLGLGVPLTWQAFDFVQTSAPTQGELVSWRESRSCTSSYQRSVGVNSVSCTTVWYPTVRYETDDGSAFENETMSTAAKDAYDVGDAVPLRFVRATPRLVRVDDWALIWAVPLGLCGAGLVAALSYWWLHRFSWRHAREDPLAATPTVVPRWASAVTLAVPTLLAIGAAFLAMDTLEFHRSSRLTSAVVVEPAKDDNAAAVLRYEDQFGELHQGSPESSAFGALNVVGLTVNVRHRVDDPHVFRVTTSEWSLWAPTLIAAGWAGVFAVAFIGALRFIAS